METAAQQAMAWAQAGRPCALATVIETWGSAPQPVGSQLAVDHEGNFAGSVSGGCVEGAVITEAQEVMASGAARVVDFGVADETAWKVGLACGGRIRILVEKVTAERLALLAAVEQAVAARRAVAVATDLASGTTRLVPEQGADAEVGAALRAGRSRLVEQQFIAVHVPQPRLIITGAVHIAQHLAGLARGVGFAVAVIDPRGAFATVARFPADALHEGWPEEVLPQLGLDARTALAALTHDPKIDDPALMAALASEAFYIGALGSRRTHGQRLARLSSRGVDEAALARIRAPIGLAIGAEGAAEIALAIMAEIIAALRRATP